MSKKSSKPRGDLKETLTFRAGDSAINATDHNVIFDELVAVLDQVQEISSYTLGGDFGTFEIGNVPFNQVTIVQTLLENRYVLHGTMVLKEVK